MKRSHLVNGGVRIMEYATGGLAREEVAAQLARLDAAVEKLG